MTHILINYYFSTTVPTNTSSRKKTKRNETKTKRFSYAKTRVSPTNPVKALVGFASSVCGVSNSTILPWSKTITLYIRCKIRQYCVSPFLLPFPTFLPSFLLSFSLSDPKHRSAFNIKNMGVGVEGGKRREREKIHIAVNDSVNAVRYR
jgi:hypothetical protein